MRASVVIVSDAGTSGRQYDFASATLRAGVSRGALTCESGSGAFASGPGASGARYGTSTSGSGASGARYGTSTSGSGTSSKSAGSMMPRATAVSK